MWSHDTVENNMDTVAHSSASQRWVAPNSVTPMLYTTVWKAVDLSTGVKYHCAHGQPGV